MRPYGIGSNGEFDPEPLVSPGQGSKGHVANVPAVPPRAESTLPLGWIEIYRRIMKRTAAFLCMLLIEAGFIWPAAGQDLGTHRPDPASIKPKPADHDLSSVGEAVVRLLETKDAKKFGQEIAPSLDDWRSFQLTNKTGEPDAPSGPSDKAAFDIRSREMAANAERLLDQAAALGISRVRFEVKEVSAESFSTFRHPQFQAEGDSMPWAYHVEVVMRGEPMQPTQESDRLRGEYRVLVASAGKFPTGWRCQEGIRWKSLPEGVADTQTTRELNFLNKWSNPFCDLTLADDPALGQLGNTLIKFLKRRDEKLFVSDALMSLDESWVELTNKLAMVGRKIPDKKELEPSWAAFQSQIAESAKAVLAQAEQFGLPGAEIQLKEAVAEKAYQRGGIGSLENITCDQMRFTLSVRSDHSISGDYVLSASGGRRGHGRWTISTPIRWQQFPEGVLDEAAASRSEFENFVAEHGVLPPGTPAPDVQFVRMDDDAKARLADFRGKIVLLEFWASWCGPCQAPMAKLQTLRQKHPDWKDQVEIVTVSIDDELKTARDHLNKRGWTNTVALWAGPGGWRSGAAKSFRVTGIPTTYLLNSQRKVAWAGHPGDGLGATIDSLLRMGSPNATTPTGVIKP